jgi:hypothetical protein
VHPLVNMFPEKGTLKLYLPSLEVVTFITERQHSTNLG